MLVFESEINVLVDFLNSSVEIMYASFRVQLLPSRHPL